MIETSSEAGLCPNCGTSVPESRILIEYSRTNGDRGIFAECPCCEEVIRPT